MGKTTLYHPVSLQVIRGAAAYQGFSFRKIKQIKADPATGKALYVADLNGFPLHLSTAPTWRVWADLAECFVDDVHIVRMGEREFGGLVVWLATQAEVDSDEDGE